MQRELVNKQSIPSKDSNVSGDFFTYYQMWVNRMKDGHNTDSRAMHYGFHPDPDNLLSSEAAKLQTNALIAEQLRLPKDQSTVVGDLGCGVGGTALYMADALPQNHIMAVNIHPPQLQLLRNFPDFPNNRITTLNANFLHLPLATESLDGAYAIDSSCYAQNKVQFYTEALRCIKPGGRLVIFDVFNKRLPSNQEEERIVEDSCTGWMVPNWHSPTVTIPGFKFNFHEITPHVLPDIQRSCEGALSKINKTTDAILQGHYQAIISLHTGLTTGLLQYGLLIGTKKT
jgi:SAM-dependent methyltransferase